MSASAPIVIDRVERSRGGGEAVRLRLGGHRLTAASPPELDPLLVVRLHGRRHRFAAEKTDDHDASSGAWDASFIVPDWAVPGQPDQAVLWVGDASVPVPPVGTRTRIAEPGLPAAGPNSVGEPMVDAPARVGAELEARQAELRREVDRLIEAVAEQQANFERRLDEPRERSQAELVQARDDADRARSELARALGEAAALREQLAATSISRDAAVAEAGGLRAELLRLGSEVALARERSEAGGGELGVAHQLLEDARTLTAQLRGQSGG